MYETYDHIQAWAVEANDAVRFTSDDEEVMGVVVTVADEDDIILTVDNYNTGDRETYALDQFADVDLITLPTT